MLVWLSLLTTVWAGAPVKSYKDIPSPEGNARRITEVMRTRLGLTEKQEKKIYKIRKVYRSFEERKRRKPWVIMYIHP